MRLQVSFEVSLLLKRCFRHSKRSVEFSDLFHNRQSSFSSVKQSCEVDVFEHPRFCDEFSHLVKGGFYTTASLF